MPAASSSATTITTIPSDFRTLPDSTAFVPLQPPVLAYTQSSQYTNWRFNQTQLVELRDAANRGAKARCVESWKGKGKARADDPGAGDGDHDGVAQTLPFPTVTDELELIRFYLNKVPALTRALALPEFVGASAMSYIKRFYLRNSCLEWHPKHIMLTSLFLATKTENVPVPLNTFASKVSGGGKNATRETIEENARSIREHEFLVSQSLGFEFMLWGAGRALAGLLADIQLLDPPLPLAKYHELAQAAQEPLALSRLSDAEFLFTPAQIALACLRAAEAKVFSSDPSPDPSDKGVTQKWGEGQLGQLTKPFVLGKESQARMAAAKARKERDALRKTDAERLERFLPPSANGAADASTANVASPSGTGNAEGSERASTSKVPNPALALSHKNGSFIAVLDDCISLIRAEAELKSGASATAAERMERVKAVDRNIKACKPPASPKLDGGGAVDAQQQGLENGDNSVADSETRGSGNGSRKRTAAEATIGNEGDADGEGDDSRSTKRVRG
ncbi:hypothetical protein V8E36_005026 [Tilletia maclaganii]